MIAGAYKHITDCNSFKLRQRMISSFALSLLVSVFFTSASFAQDVTPEINPDYLNNLTPNKVSWTKATDEEITAVKDIVLIDGTYYKYSYNKPETPVPPEINPDYLNNLTPDKVSWTKATDAEITAGKDIVLIDGTYYKYSYNKPADYNETNTRLNNNLTESNTQSVVFKNISATANGGAIL